MGSNFLVFNVLYNILYIPRMEVYILYRYIYLYIYIYICAENFLVGFMFWTICVVAHTIFKITLVGRLFWFLTMNFMILEGNLGVQFEDMIFA